MGSGYRGTLAQLDAASLARVRHKNLASLAECKAMTTNVVYGVTGVRLRIEQIHLVIEWIIAIGVVSALKSAGKLDFFERVNGQNL